MLTAACSIRHVAEPFGICKVIPPRDAWSVGSDDSRDNDLDESAVWLREVDASKFRFPTKLQPVHMLMRCHSPAAVFCAQLFLFEQSCGREWDAPLVDSRHISLYDLYCAVVSRGGFDALGEDNTAWFAVLDQVKLSDDGETAKRVRSVYRECLLEYERHCGTRLPLSTDAEIAAAVQADAALQRRLADFSYGDGGDWSLSAYRRMADAFANSYFDCSDDDDDAPSVKRSAVDVDLVEREYWQIVEGRRGAVEVPYGNDLSAVRVAGSHAHGAAHRTLFPMSARDHSTYSGWNLNRLARCRGSLLRYVHHTLPGITDPMVYVGMLFTTFCWHTEDNYLASINYLHGGAPKVWYGVPAVHRAAFEALMRARFADLFAQHPDLLYQLVTTLDPRALREHGISCVRAVQRGGEFIITFPASFHAGFNCGFNIAEAVNFGTEHWLAFGRRSLEDYHRRDGNRPSAFSYHNLLCLAARAALADDMLRELALAVVNELRTVRQDLIDTCATLAAAGVTRVDKFPHYDGDSANAEVDLIQCFDCQVDCFLLAVVCPCTPVGRLSCPKHYDRLCGCANSQRCQLVRYSPHKLGKLIDALVVHVPSLPSLNDVRPPTREQIRADAHAIDKWRETHETARGMALQENSGEPIRRMGVSKRRRVKL